MEIFNVLVTPVSTLLGLLIGAFATYFTQARIKEKELKREVQKEQLGEITKCLELYNEVLKLDGDLLLINTNDERQIFQLGVYQEKLRPLLYTKFHLLHKEVAQKVRELDKVTYDERFKGHENDYAIDIYNKMITYIEENLDTLRCLYYHKK